LLDDLMAMCPAAIAYRAQNEGARREDDEEGNDPNVSEAGLKNDATEAE
jgi:hypothetical protein